MDKHLLAENPMRSPEGGLCIIRTVQPISIYEVYEGHIKFGIGSIYKQYTYVGSTGEREDFALRAHHFFSTDIDTVDESIVYKFMDDAWFWYMAVLKYEDEIFDDMEKE